MNIDNISKNKKRIFIAMRVAVGVVQCAAIWLEFVNSWRGAAGCWLVVVMLLLVSELVIYQPN